MSLSETNRLRIAMLSEFVIIGVWRLCILCVYPAAIFWALRVLNSAWSLPYTWETVCAFWILYAGLRIGVQTIRYSEWESPIRREFSDML